MNQTVSQTQMCNEAAFVLTGSRHAPLSNQTIDHHICTKLMLYLLLAMHNVQPSSVLNTLLTIHHLHANACMDSAEGL